MLSHSKHLTGVGTSNKLTKDSYMHLCAMYGKAYTQAHQDANTVFQNFFPEIIRLAGFVEIAKCSVNLFFTQDTKSTIRQIAPGVQ